MAYELSSSIGGDKTVNHIFVPARTSTNTKGGYPNLDGTKIATPSSRHGGAGSTDLGIDIWHSGASGWFEAESIDSGANLVKSLFWFSNDEIITIESDNRVRSYASASSGWYNQYSSTGQASNGQHLILSPQRSRLVVLQNFQVNSSTNMDDPCFVFIYESASSGFNTVNSYSALAGRVTAVSFVNETNLLLGQPGFQNSGDAGRVQHISYDGSSWSNVRSCIGHSGTNAKSFGAALHWHTASNSLLVGARGSGGSVFSMWLIPSQSSGYIPSSNPHNAPGAVLLTGSNGTGTKILDSSRIDLGSSVTSNAFMASGVGLFTSSHGSRLVGTTISHQSFNDGRVFFTIESGSEGWKFNQFEDDGVASQETSGVGLNIAGDSSIYVGYQTGSLNVDQGGFTVYRFFASSGGASPGFTLNKSSLSLTEGQNDEVTVVLDAQPASNVVLTASLHSDFDGRATLTNHLLTFTNENWNSAQTLQVTASQDLIDNNNVGPNNITFSIVDASSDDNYDSVSDQTVALTVVDNDTAGFTLTPSASPLNVIEGSTGTISVLLNSKPTGNVVFDVTTAVSLSSRASLSVSTLTFTPDNFNSSQTVTINATQDSKANGNASGNITFAINQSSTADSKYDALPNQTVALTVVDNDVAGIIMQAPRLGSLIADGNVIVSETGGEDELQVQLSAQPTHDVTVSVTGVDTTEFTVSGAPLIFTSANWNKKQSLNFKGLPDKIADGNTTTSITLTAASSDSAFNGVSITKSITNLDTVPTGGFEDPCTLISPDYTINYYTCALGQYDYHKSLPFRFGGSKNISNVRKQSTDSTHKTFLGERKT